MARNRLPDGIFVLRVSGAMSMLTGLVFGGLIASRFDNFDWLTVVATMLPAGYFIGFGATAFIPSKTRTNKWAVVHLLGTLLTCFTTISSALVLFYWNEIWSDEWPEIEENLTGSRRMLLAAVQVGTTLFGLASLLLMWTLAANNQPHNRVVDDDGTPMLVQKLEGNRSGVIPAKGPYDTWGYRTDHVWFASDDRGKPLITVEVGTVCNWRCSSDLKSAKALGEATGAKVVAIIEDCPDDGLDEFLAEFQEEHGEADYVCQNWQIDSMWEYLPAIRIFDSTGRQRYVSDTTWPSDSQLEKIVNAAEETAEMAPPILPEEWMGEWCFEEIDASVNAEEGPQVFADELRRKLYRKATRVVVSTEGMKLRMGGKEWPASVTHASPQGVYARTGDAPAPFGDVVMLRKYDDGPHLVTTDRKTMSYHKLTRDRSNCSESLDPETELNFELGEGEGPEWTKAELSEWPQMVLTNDFGRDPGGYVIPGASSFLAKSGETVAVATARQLLGSYGGFEPELEPADVEKAPIPWTAHVRGKPERAVEAKKVLTTYPNGWVDVLALEVPGGGELPAVPLEIREEMPDLGEKVVLVACSDGSPDCEQRAVRGVVIERTNEQTDFVVVLESPVIARNMRGAPVVDRDGRALGLVTAGAYGGGPVLVIWAVPTFYLFR